MHTSKCLHTISRLLFPGLGTSDLRTQNSAPNIFPFEDGSKLIACEIPCGQKVAL